MSNEYRAHVYYSGNDYLSNTITFIADLGDEENVDKLNMSLTLHNGKNSFDSYPLYGPDMSLINPGEAHVRRHVYFSYDSSIGGSLEPDVLNGATAYFYIPKNATMLSVPTQDVHPYGAMIDETVGTEHEMIGYFAQKKAFTDEFSE
jgi:hypothetical protein